jgi:hypothetical protein
LLQIIIWRKFLPIKIGVLVGNQNFSKNHLDIIQSVKWIFKTANIEGIVKFVEYSGLPRWDVYQKTSFLTNDDETNPLMTVNSCIKALDLDCSDFDSGIALATTALSLEKSNLPDNIPETRLKCFRSLLVIDEFGTKSGGIAAFNRQLVLELAELPDTEVFIPQLICRFMFMFSEIAVVH